METLWALHLRCTIISKVWERKQESSFQTPFPISWNGWRDQARLRYMSITLKQQNIFSPAPIWSSLSITIYPKEPVIWERPSMHHQQGKFWLIITLPRETTLISSSLIPRYHPPANSFSGSCFRQVNMMSWHRRKPNASIAGWWPIPEGSPSTPVNLRFSRSSACCCAKMWTRMQSIHTFFTTIPRIVFAYSGSRCHSAWRSIPNCTRPWFTSPGRIRLSFVSAKGIPKDL